MFSKLIRILFTLLSVAVAVFVVLSASSYSSLIPEEYNPIKMFSFSKDSLSVEAIEPIETEANAETSLDGETIEENLDIK